MNTNIEDVEPVWQYEAVEHPLSEVISLQLILWAKGLCAIGYDETGTPQKVKTYFLPSDWDVDFIEEVFVNEPLFAGPEPFTNVWFVEERNIIVPQDLFVKDYVEEWIRKFHFLESDEVLLTDDLNPSVNAQIVFPIKAELKDLLAEYMEGAKLKALSKTALRQKTHKNTIEIINLPKVCLISFHENGKYVFHQAAPYEATEDILYKIAVLLQERDLTQEGVGIDITGIAPFWNNILEELTSYFSFEEDISDTTQITLDYLKKLYLCAL